CDPFGQTCPISKDCTMRRIWTFLLLVSCLVGCSRSAPPSNQGSSITPDETETSEAPGIIRGKPVAYWVGELNNSDQEAANRAGNFLAMAGSAAVPVLIDALKDPSENVRTRAGITLGRIAAKDSVPTAKLLVVRLKDDSLAPRILVVLAENKNLGTAAVPELALALQDKNPAVRAYAAQALRDIGPDADFARPALVKALKDPEDKPRALAAEALARIGPGFEDENALVDALKDKNVAVRTFAA